MIHTASQFQGADLNTEVISGKGFPMLEWACSADDHDLGCQEKYTPCEIVVEDTVQDKT